MKEMGMFLRKLLYFLLFKREAWFFGIRTLLFLKEINFLLNTNSSLSCIVVDGSWGL
jgi:hypothetical protein